MFVITDKIMKRPVFKEHSANQNFGELINSKKQSSFCEAPSKADYCNQKA
jgi:hypothetical protein